MSMIPSIGGRQVEEQEGRGRKINDKSKKKGGPFAQLIVELIGNELHVLLVQQ